MDTEFRDYSGSIRGELFAAVNEEKDRSSLKGLITVWKWTKADIRIRGISPDGLRDPSAFRIARCTSGRWDSPGSEKLTKSTKQATEMPLPHDPGVVLQTGSKIVRPAIEHNKSTWFVLQRGYA